MKRVDFLTILIAVIGSVFFMLTIFSNLSPSILNGTLLLYKHENSNLVIAQNKDPDGIDPILSGKVLGIADIKRNQVLETMTLEEKIGQLFIVGYNKEDQFSQQLQLIESMNIGGVILFRNNVSDSTATQNSISSIKRISDMQKVPLFIAIDEEGGQVTRLYDQMPYQRSQPQITNPEQAYQTGLLRGRKLKELGVNMNFSPVMDYSANNMASLYPRTFRVDKGNINLLSSEMVRGYKEIGVIAVPKHFPGHPDNEVDSHKELPMVDVSREQFDDFALQFKEMMEKNPPEAIMTAHVKFPAIDPASPTTLSHTILTDILRKDYKYDGLIISDDMNMGAIKNELPFEEACIRAIEAGVDILVVVTRPDYQASAYEAVLGAVKNGRISEERIDQSLIRIIRLKNESL